MKIAVAGAGYVGLSNAILLAQKNEVVLYDIDAAKIALINERISPIVDTDIEHFMTYEPLTLRATSDASDAFAGAEYIVIATPTDYDEITNYFNTSSITSVMSAIAALKLQSTIVIKSTVPVGYTKSVSDSHHFGQVLFSPEFLREGNALHDNLYPSRIIVGGDRAKAMDFASLMLEGSRQSAAPILITDHTEAEAIKLFSNTYLAMRVAFFNELDTYADTHKLNSREIIDGVGLDPRIGSHYNNPSFGYGGYCLPKDTKQLLSNYQDVPQNLISAIVAANATRKEFIAKAILQRRPKVAGVYRLTMKTNSDNFRESSIQDIIRMLQDNDVEVLIFEPLAKGASFLDAPITVDLDDFKMRSDVIIANRISDDLLDVKDKLFTRDLFGND
jgi:UDPglucose 6-dehydrogenase